MKSPVRKFLTGLFINLCDSFYSIYIAAFDASTTRFTEGK
jgi:hypothetical protein